MCFFVTRSMHHVSTITYKPLFMEVDSVTGVSRAAMRFGVFDLSAFLRAVHLSRMSTAVSIKCKSLWSLRASRFLMSKPTPPFCG